MNQDYATRLQSLIPTPVAKYGNVVRRNEQQLITYDGMSLPYFLDKHKGNPRAYRQFLRQNQVGRFTDLEPGRSVVVTQPDTFAVNEDY